MLQNLASRSRAKPLFVSDELPHYATVLAEQYHAMVPSTPTGKPGRPKNAEQVIDADLDYATVHKTRESGRVVQVDRRVVYGSEQSVRDRLADSPSQKINTAYIERSNLNWRLWDAHLARKSLTFARSLRWLRAKFAIVVSCYNLIRPHGTLSRRADRVFTYHSCHGGGCDGSSLDVWGAIGIPGGLSMKWGHYPILVIRGYSDILICRS